MVHNSSIKPVFIDFFLVVWIKHFLYKEEIENSNSLVGSYETSKRFTVRFSVHHHKTLLLELLPLYFLPTRSLSFKVSEHFHPLLTPNTSICNQDTVPLLTGRHLHSDYLLTIIWFSSIAFSASRNAVDNNNHKVLHRKKKILWHEMQREKKQEGRGRNGFCLLWSMYGRKK